jgi:undecaprenyl-diphosphatase
MPLLKVLILAIVQGLAELLPVSSSAHVVVTEKLMGLDPSSPQMTLLLAMLHTGTMFSVIVYFWSQWKRSYFSSADAAKRFAIRAAWGTLLTLVVGYPILHGIEHSLAKSAPAAACAAQDGDIEVLFSKLNFAAPALLASGILILIAGLRERSADPRTTASYERSTARSGENVTFAQAGWMGAVQALCLPFRGFSRSGATISTGLLAGSSRLRAERFSFALAVLLTPLVLWREVGRLLKAVHSASGCVAADLHGSAVAAIAGMVFSFFAGLAALRWLSSWLEHGRWYLFGIYCLVASGFVFWLSATGH